MSYASIDLSTQQKLCDRIGGVRTLTNLSPSRLSAASTDAHGGLPLLCSGSDMLAAGSLQDRYGQKVKSFNGYWIMGNGSFSCTSKTAPEASERNLSNSRKQSQVKDRSTANFQSESRDGSQHDTRNLDRFGSQSRDIEQRSGSNDYVRASYVAYVREHKYSNGSGHYRR